MNRPQPPRPTPVRPTPVASFSSGGTQSTSPQIDASATRPLTEEERADCSALSTWMQVCAWTGLVAGGAMFLPALYGVYFYAVFGVVFGAVAFTMSDAAAAFKALVQPGHDHAKLIRALERLRTLFRVMLLTSAASTVVGIVIAAVASSGSR